MKAIITEMKNGFKSYMVFESDSEKVYEVFTKIAKNSGFAFIKNEAEFDELKDDNFPFEIKLFNGKGIYTNGGELVGNTLIDAEDDTKYYLDENYTQIGDTIIKMVDNLKLVNKATLFN